MSIETTDSMNELNNKLDEILKAVYMGGAYEESYGVDALTDGPYPAKPEEYLTIKQAIQAIQDLLAEQVRLGRIDELLRFDEWLRERSHLDLRMVAGKRVRDHIWIRKSDIERSQLKSTTLLEGGK